MSAALGLATVAALPASEEPTFGFSYVPISENSDNYIPLPYAKTPLWQGALSDDATVSGSFATFTLPGCAAPTVPCYLRFRTGALAGRFYHVAAGSTQGSLIVNTNGDNQAALAVAGDEVSLIPFWTLGELLPATGFDFILPRENALSSQCRLDPGAPLMATLFHLHGQGKRFPTNTGAPFYDPSLFGQYNELSGGFGDLTTYPSLSVLFPDLQASGTSTLPLMDEAWPVAQVTAVDTLPGDTGNDPAWGPIHFVHSTTHWRDAQGHLLDGRIIPPDGFVVLRVGSLLDHPGGTYLTLGGTKENHPLTVPLSSDISSAQDTYFSFPITRPTAFQDLGWTGGLLYGPGAFNPAGDELFAYWPGVSGFQRAPDAMFYPTLADGWVDSATVTTLPSDFLIPPHTVFFVRKAPTGTGVTSFLQVTPSN